MYICFYSLLKFECFEVEGFFFFERLSSPIFRKVNILSSLASKASITFFHALVNRIPQEQSAYLFLCIFYTIIPTNGYECVGKPCHSQKLMF